MHSPITQQPGKYSNPNLHPAQAQHRPLLAVLPELVGQGLEQRLDEVLATGEPYLAHAVLTFLDRGGCLESVYLDISCQPIIIMLSTSAHPRDLLRLDLLPITDWVSKPLTREKVDDLLQQYFHRQLPPEV